MGTIAATALMFVGDQCGRTAEALELYSACIPGLVVTKLIRREDASEGLEGDVVRAEFTIGDARFIAFDSRHPHAFTFTPAVSIWLDLDSFEALDSVAEQLAENGRVHMPIGSYGFSERFTWVDDRYGVSWQLNVPG